MNQEDLWFLDIPEDTITEHVKKWRVHHENNIDDQFYQNRDILSIDLSNYAMRNGKNSPPWIYDVPIIKNYSGDKIDPLYHMNDAFKPEYNERACGKLTIAKDEVCKSNKKSHKCKTAMTDEEIREVYINRIHCANLRALETKSHCYNKNGKINPEDKTHDMATQDAINSAKYCIDLYQSKRSISKEERTKEEIFWKTKKIK